MAWLENFSGRLYIYSDLLFLLYLILTFTQLLQYNVKPINVSNDNKFKKFKTNCSMN